MWSVALDKLSFGKPLGSDARRAEWAVGSPHGAYRPCVALVLPTPAPTEDDADEAREDHDRQPLRGADHHLLPPRELVEEEVADPNGSVLRRVRDPPGCRLGDGLDPLENRSVT